MSIQIESSQAVPAFRLVAKAIEEKILSRTIAPGDLLPSEAGLAEQLGVNRSTIREAIRVLEQNGFVRREQGRKKLFACIPHSADISRRLTTAMVLHQVTFEELWEAMFALEPMTAEAAAHRSKEAGFEAIEKNLAETRSALKSSSSLTELDIEFHELIAKASVNRALQMARMPLSELFYPAFYAVMSRLNAGERLLYAHEQIYSAIRNHDVANSRLWMEKHIQDFRRGYELANLNMATPVDLPDKSGSI